MSTFKGQLKTSSGDILYPQTSIDKVTGFPTTSAGDLIYGGTGGELTTLAAGTDGQILKSSNGAPQWGANIPEKTQGIFYAQVDSTSTSTNFTVTIPELTATEYYDGLTLLLYNGKVTSASGFTINVNGLGAKPSYSNMALGNSVTPTDPTRDTTIFNINYAMLFIYNSTRVSGGCWICYRGYDANTNTIGYQVRTNNSTLKASDKFYRYRLLFTSADGTQWVPANTSTSTNATSARNVNQRPINPFGEITWYGTTTAIEANANVTAAQLWQQYYGTYTLIGYSFNNTGAAATMTANRPIYIKCTPQSNGSAIIDANTPYVQTLPSTDDGKIYIFLGRAVSATAFEILLNHPVYYYKDGAIRIWTNPTDSGMANPMTSLGDMIYGDAGADPIKLSIGTSGQVLTSDGSIPYWATPATPATVGTLDTTATTAQTTSASESFSNNITLHKVSKTGSYSDLNDKPTIPVDTNTTYTLNVSGTGDNANKVGLVAGGSGSGTTWYTIPYATNAGSANSVAWSNVSGHADGVKTDIGIESSGTTFLRKDGTWATPSGTGMSNPMTTKGDMIIGSTDGNPVRLAGSGTTKFLQSTGGSNGITISWEDIQGTAIKSGTTGSYATNGQVLTAGGDGTAVWTNVPEEIYIATYGSTTYSQIALALSLGQAVVVPITVSGVTSIGYLCTFDSTGAVFRMPGNDSIAVATCSASDSTWTATTYPYSAAETYQATYGTTTYTDISTADSAGKLCYVKYQGYVYIVSSIAVEGIIFSCATSSAIKTVYVDNQDTWGNQSYAFAAGTVTSVAVSNGGGISVSGSPITSSGTITISHADTSSQASVDNSGRTYIQDITLDTYGHVTGLTSATETVTDTNTTYTLNVSGTGANANKVGLVAGGSGSGTTWYTIPYASSSDTANSATTAGSATTASTADVANSVAWANVSGHADGVKTDIGIESSGTTFLRKDGTWATPTAGMSNPMTTKGDIIVGGTDGTPIRLAGSGTTKFLQSTGGSNGITLSWTDIQGTTVKSGTTGSYATSGQMLTADGSGNTSWTTPFTGYTSSNKLSTDYINNVAGWTSNAGTVTSVGITNGGGLSVSGSPITSSGSITLSHDDTSSQASVSNSGRTYIQSVTLDDYGHVTALSSATETVTDTNTTYTLNVSGTGDNANKVGLVAGGSGSGTTWYTIPYATSAESAEKDSDGNVIKNTYLKSVSTVKNDLTLLKEGSSPGDSYSLIFQRGTLTDNFNDWRIQDRGGFLYFDQRGSGSSSWADQVYFNTSGTVYATTFSGSGASLTSLNASNISSGTINVARLPSITSDKVSDFTTAARGALSGTSPISYSSSTGAIGIESTGASSGQVLTADGSGGVSWATPASGGMANPMTTAGDIIYGGSSGTPTRLGVGTNGQVLSSNGSAPTWTSLPADTNQTVTVGSDTFGANAAISFTVSDNITITADTTNNTITIGGSDIFLATYGTTTFMQISLAILAGQLCGVEYQGDIYIISNASPSGYTFSSVSSTGVKTVSVSSSNVWGSQSAQILPAVTSADTGKILMVDSNGNWVAATMAQWQLGGSY